MKRAIKNIIKGQLAKNNLSIELNTHKEQIQELIKKLYPHKTQFQLIRMGPNGDGGYLVPDDLENIKACFSPGVSAISDFEMDCYKKGMQIYMADKSVDKVNLNLPENEYGFIKKFIGCTNNEDFITIDNWVQQELPNDNESDLLLQMDIEGGEYDTLINASDKLMNRFRIMVIEFHTLEKLWNPDFFHFAKLVFDKILQTHVCVHNHPNNCCGIESKNGIEIPRFTEFTFLRKDRITNSTFETTFPHELDFDNTKKEHIALPKDWYKA
ncbi:FkbM family methyltransferase [Paracrocinitomix mangrovi]|uniref:FkbM family methyltransferase n=1 Tax=Paracrocinitomix mangrovi TaxID=2862509 RepID=UPI001C8D5985|nr:FkbM family methyltransferase [Paracrocinitomix mangrovi]UKN01568.1 FkbM family methyltransferase [Paracrocinitomix mangrovi]